MSRIVGIDLGTTNTVVAVLDGERPRVLADERGHSVIPSVLGWKSADTYVTGHAAANLLITRPDRAVYAVKRLIGRRHDDASVQDALQRATYETRAGADGGVEVRVGEAWLRPQDVAAELLKTARAAASRALGEPVEEAVITVPAYFNHAQRRATLEAARLAGLRCERLLNEPTAAALAYGHRKSLDARVVIFDLGGGTFDVSVLRMRDGVYEILSTSGDTFLGGEDFDARIVAHLCAHVQERHAWDPRNDRGAMRRLKEAAEQAKRELSQRESVTVQVPHLGPKVSVETTLTRAEVETLTADLVERCLAVVEEALVQARLEAARLDDVILVGGMTRWPAVQGAVRARFGKEPSRGVHPDEVVAMGAAVHAGSLEEGAAPRAVLLDVTPFDLGIDAAAGAFATVIGRNSRVPCAETRTFVTTADDQSEVRITVRQGESRLARDNEFLGAFTFEGLPPLPRMQAKVDVTFRIDANGMLHVSARDPSSGEERRMTVQNYGEVARGEGHAQVQGEGRDADVTGSDGTAMAPAPADEHAPEAPARLKAVVGEGVRAKRGFLEALFGRKSAPADAPPAGRPSAEADPAADEGDAPVEVSVSAIEAIEDAPEAEEPPTAADALVAVPVEEEPLAFGPLDLEPEAASEAPQAVVADIVFAFDGDSDAGAPGADLSSLFDDLPAPASLGAFRGDVDGFAVETDADDEDECDPATEPGAKLGPVLTLALPSGQALTVWLRAQLAQASDVTLPRTLRGVPVGGRCRLTLLVAETPALELPVEVRAVVPGGVRVRLTLDDALRASLEARLD
jgi:molecular chaperone DnaK